MAYILDEVWVNNGQLIVAEVGEVPTALGDGVGKVRHSAYIEGPLQVGNTSNFTSAEATVMIGKDGNMETANALSIKGDILQAGDIEQTGNINQKGTFTTTGKVKCGSLSSGLPKSFDIEHPTKGKGWRLRYACIEGPEAGVYYRGRLKNQKVIRLPYYWKDLVSVDSIAVQLQPIGAHQDIIVKRWDDEYIHLQAQGGLPINCFYHVYAERNDIDKLEVEYEGLQTTYIVLYCKKMESLWKRIGYQSA